jgi:hypothetical protein
LSWIRFQHMNLKGMGNSGLCLRHC